jgi:hypothetical protein
MHLFSRPTSLATPTVRRVNIGQAAKTLSALSLLSLLSVSLSPAYAQTVNGVIVPGDANPYLSGMPNGSTAVGSDSAPDQSPIQVTGLNLSAGGFLTFAVTGSVSFVGNASPTNPPDGTGLIGHAAENGFGGHTLPLDALVGVFLTDAQPNLSAAPPALDFSVSGLGISFLTLSPQLKQVFFIGDGLTGTGSGNIQQFNIPSGATRFFLGTSDGFGWFNNSGQFTVNINQTGGVSAAAPEPATVSLITAVVFGALASRYRLRRRRSSSL